MDKQSLYEKYENYLVEQLLLSQHGWKARFDKKPKQQCAPFTLPRMKQIPDIVMMGYRYVSSYYLQRRYVDKSMPFINPFDPIEWKPIYGVPAGGIGSGAIARGFRGEFCRSSILPGVYNFDLNPVDLFIVTLKKRGLAVYQQVLSVSKEAPPNSGIGLKSWNWGFPEVQGYYIGLYPRSWTVYELPRFNLLLICKQVSPIIPHDYKDTCLPCVAFEWSLVNFGTEEELECTITMTWRGPRHPIRAPAPHQGAAARHSRKTSEDLDVIGDLGRWSEANTGVRISPVDVPAEKGKLRGCILETRISNDISCAYGLAARITNSVTVTRCSGFNIDSSSEQQELEVKRPGQQQPTGVQQMQRQQSDADLENMKSEKEAPSAKQLWNDLLYGSGLANTDSDQVFTSRSSMPLNKMAGGPAPGTNSPSHDRFTPDRLAMAVSATAVCKPVTYNDKTSVIPSVEKLEFFLTWHTPRVHFRSAEVAYHRRYVRWFPQLGRTGTKRLLAHTADRWHQWNSQIEDWQRPYLMDQNLPDWYKSALFNELYFLTDGGTVWLDPIPPVPVPNHNGFESIPECTSLPNSPSPGIAIPVTTRFNNNLVTPLSLNASCTLDEVTLPEDVLPFDLVRSNVSTLLFDPLKLTGRHLRDQPDNPKWATWLHRLDLGREIGLFGYIEGHEYRMYNTYDVHHFSSWALLVLWPKLQWSINYDFADQCVAHDCETISYIYKGKQSPRSDLLAIPHDLGDPEDEPWRRSNAYIMFPTDTWKDLPPKFILNVWRDFRYNHDWAYMLYMLPICVRLFEAFLQKYDTDGDGVVENSGFPDQTYDAWSVKGVSAYTGGLWISSVYAMYDMLRRLLDEAEHQQQDLPVRMAQQPSPLEGKTWQDLRDRYAALTAQANASFDRKLWNGVYYDFQACEGTSSSVTSKSIMAAQLCGYWTLVLSGAPENCVLSRDKVHSVLETIKRHNWLGIADGRYGAVNGMLPIGEVTEQAQFQSRLDTTSVQSEEFWIGINYALAATMIMENMEEDGFRLAGSIYNAVYNELGMHFQTPEAIMESGTYRSLGYMRPLAIWSMQLAYELKHKINMSKCSPFSS